jgi:hypothetical protein
MHVFSPGKLPVTGGLSFVFVALLLWLLPIKDALQPGGDEGCEALQSVLFSSDFSLYSGGCGTTSGRSDDLSLLHITAWGPEAPPAQAAEGVLVAQFNIADTGFATLAALSALGGGAHCF